MLVATAVLVVHRQRGSAAHVGGFVRFFEAVDGIPAICRVDNMGALFVHPAPRGVLHAPALDFARHHGVAIRPCMSADAKRKGKVERPFRDLK